MAELAAARKVEHAATTIPKVGGRLTTGNPVLMEEQLF
jgi:hypothetical protein